MACITKKLRGYGAFALLLQMPIVMVQRSRWLRGRTLLNVSLHLTFRFKWLTGVRMFCFGAP